MKTKYMEDVKLTGVMAERVGSDGKRKIKLQAAEKKEMTKNKQVETAVAMFLCMEQSYTWEEIAKEVGCSMRYLKEMTKSDQFIELYNEHFVELGHDPRLKASQGAIADMLPLAVKELKTLITQPGVSSNVKLGAIKEVLRLNGVAEPKIVQSDKNELTQFLKDANVTVTQNNLNVTVPPEFADKIHEYTDGYFEVPSLPVGDVEEE